MMERTPRGVTKVSHAAGFNSLIQFSKPKRPYNRNESMNRFETNAREALSSIDGETCPAYIFFSSPASAYIGLKVVAMARQPISNRATSATAISSATFLPTPSRSAPRLRTRRVCPRSHRAATAPTASSAALTRATRRRQSRRIS
jgi:hypothetical protein